jgi:threonine-phosphate decarboxylase
MRTPTPERFFREVPTLNQIHGGDIYGIARRHNLEPGAILDFSASINPLGLSPKAKKKLGKEGISAVLHYPDPECFELRRAVARFHGITEDLILPGAGSTEFIYSVPRALKIRKALIVTPAFSEYEAGLESSGEPCEIHFLETTERDGFELNVEGLILALTQGYDALYLCNPNSPTGILTERKDLLRILARTEREKTWFILDEAFIDFLPEESLADVAGASSRLLILRTLANFFSLPGLRAGYLLSNPEMIQHLSRMQPPWPVNAIAQVAAVESLRDEAFISRSQETVRLQREFLTQGLRAIPGFIPYPSAANFLFVQLHPSLKLTAGELRERLIPRGILIRDCSSFHHLGPYFFRIAVRPRRENQALLRALRRVHSEIIHEGPSPNYSERLK